MSGTVSETNLKKCKLSSRFIYGSNSQLKSNEKRLESFPIPGYFNLLLKNITSVRSILARLENYVHLESV